MTPQFEAALAAIQLLDATERQQLLKILNSQPNFPTDLKTLGTQFWHSTTLKELLATQSPTTVDNLKDLAADFWPEEDSIEDFLTFLCLSRQEVV